MEQRKDDTRRRIGLAAWETRRNRSCGEAPQGWIPPANLPSWTAKDTARFWGKVDRTGGDDACWLWLASKTWNGYGMFGVGHTNLYVHRITLGNPVPTGFVVDHLCRTRNCVNPKHLEVITNRENCERGLRGVLLTHCKHGHERTAANTLLETYGGRTNRRCRICLSARRKRPMRS